MNEEQAWALEAQQGSDEAFTKLVDTYQTPVYNLCYRLSITHKLGRLISNQFP